MFLLMMSLCEAPGVDLNDLLRFTEDEDDDEPGEVRRLPGEVLLSAVLLGRCEASLLELVLMDNLVILLRVDFKIEEVFAAAFGGLVDLLVEVEANEDELELLRL